MNDKERLKYIKEELSAIVNELKPRFSELFFIQGCLEDLARVSDGKPPEKI